MKKLFLICLIFLLSFNSPLVQAQQEIQIKNARPKIGLALSGGGARGLAHIGVLEWFEQHRIPVDYIAGTSMGGLVAAMYAMGMSPQEMREFVNNLNWDEVLSSGPAYDKQSFRRKEDLRAFQNEIKLGLRGGLSAPNGFNPGHSIGLILDRLSLPYSDIKNFDELPIPFRCVATDMIEAKPVVLKDGSLPLALRATMAIPGVFPSVEYEGKVLADGGLLNNIPTDVVRQMGADIVIAVDIGTPLGDGKAMASTFGILEQSIGVMSIENDRRNLRLADIILAPDLGNYTREDYRSAKELMDLGYKGAEQKEILLKNFLLDQASFEAYLSARRAKKRNSPIVPQTIAVKGTSEDGKEKISKDLEEFVGESLDSKKLESELTAITGQGRYESVGYEAHTVNNQTNLLIRVKEKDYGPPFLNVGVNIDGSEVNHVQFGLNGRLTFYDVGAKNSEWRVDVNLGSNTLFGTEYYLPLGQSRFFIAPRAYYNKSFRNLFSDSRQVAEYQVRRAAIGADIGLSVSPHSEIRIGYEVGNLNAKVRIGDPFLPELNGKVSEARFRWAYDGQDDPIVPTRGLNTIFTAKRFFSNPSDTDDFSQAEMQSSYFISINGHGSAFGYFSGGTTFNKTAPQEQVFTLGGPLRLGAYHKDEFIADNYFIVGGGYLRHIGTLPALLGDKIYAGTWYEFGGIYQKGLQAQYLSDISGGVILKTKFGPISLGGSFGERKRGRIFFSVGRFF